MLGLRLSDYLIPEKTGYPYYLTSCLGHVHCFVLLAMLSSQVAPRRLPEAPPLGEPKLVAALASPSAQLGHVFRRIARAGVKFSARQFSQ